jgi:hypothetical protein
VYPGDDTKVLKEKKYSVRVANSKIKGDINNK